MFPIEYRINTQCLEFTGLYQFYMGVAQYIHTLAQECIYAINFKVVCETRKCRDEGAHSILTVHCKLCLLQQ